MFTNNSFSSILVKLSPPEGTISFKTIFIQVKNNNGV